VVAKKIANWRMSADEISMQVVKWFIQFKVKIGLSKLKSGFVGLSKKLFSGWRLSIEEDQAKMREVNVYDVVEKHLLTASEDH
jgi:hypothetical protein